MTIHDFYCREAFGMAPEQLIETIETELQKPVPPPCVTAAKYHVDFQLIVQFSKQHDKLRSQQNRTIAILSDWMSGTRTYGQIARSFQTVPKKIRELCDKFIDYQQKIAS